MSQQPGNLAFYIPAGLLLLTGAVKIPALLRRRHDPLLRSVCLLLFAGVGVMFCAAPGSIVGINRFTGITNFAAPLVYAMMSLFAGASLVLIINWRPAPPERTRRASQLCITTYLLSCTGIFILFWAGDAPVEQRTLFDAYYANTPYIREMILLYLLSYGGAAMATSVLCWRWSKEVSGSLRAGLSILAPAYLIAASYSVIRLIAVAARWTGHDLDFLVDTVSAQLAAPTALFGTIGFAVPLVGPRVAEFTRDLRQLRHLAPLWRELREVPPSGAVRTSLPWWRTQPAVLLTARKTAIYDAILALTPYVDSTAREQVYRDALCQGDDEQSAQFTADAAAIVTARHKHRTAHDRQDLTPHTSAWRPRDLVPVSQALTSPIVTSLRQNHRSPAESSPS
ncbi:MAB_1171c family putative transporter [Streptomyces sp. B21-083]|uniref:MAB_1171c family putative transporter n=1 Tax=Streptomyces sp. B21-083 TaxID=3039410 RepID=UPI002FF078E6